MPGTSTQGHRNDPKRSWLGGWWWKLPGTLMLLLAMVTGLRTPLSPALVHCSVDRLMPGDTSFTVTGYNTNFGVGGPPAVWIEHEGSPWCASSVHVLSTTELIVWMSVPEGMPGDLSHLVVASSTDGTLRLFDAFWTGQRGSGFTASPCTDTPVRAGAVPYTFPNRSLLYETIRNLFLHVPMWFTMMLLMGVSVYHSIRTLGSTALAHDRAAVSAVEVGLLFAALGLVTGSIWARSTWGAWWTNDTQLNGAATVTLIYLAYLVLRASVPDAHKRARLAAVYNIFAFTLMVVFFMVLPRLTDSLHPGKGGNPGFNQYDLDDRLRMVFYPAVLGWMVLGLWIRQLHLRMKHLQARHDEQHDA